MDNQQEKPLATDSEDVVFIEEFVVPGQYRERFRTVTASYAKNLVRLGLQVQTHIRAGATPPPTIR